MRIGNAAYLQRQHDLMGEMMLCLDTITADPRVVIEDHGSDSTGSVERLVDGGDAGVDTDDTGIWEFRTMPRPYTFSQRDVLGRRQPRREARAPARPPD